jgi:mono/diheme cytochrome c family protein
MSRNLVELLSARAAAVAAIVFAAAAASHLTAHSKSTQVMWTVDIAPIVESRCVRCHQPNGFGPMSLATYADAKPWAKAIRDEVLSGRMPPWSAVRGFGDFSNDRSLSAVEIELLSRWADGGAPLGPDSVPLRRDRGTDAAQSPALRVELPAVHTSGGSTERLVVPLTFSEERWISGWQFDPGVATLVEEAALSIGETAVGSWTPLDGAISYPRGVAERLPSGAALHLAIRYRRSSEPQEDRSVLTLRFGGRPAHVLQHRAFECGAHVVDGNIDVLAVTPRPAAAGDSMEVAAYRLDASIEPLCVIAQFHPEYTPTYRLRLPARLDRGTRIEVRSSSAGCTATIDYVTR